MVADRSTVSRTVSTCGIARPCLVIAVFVAVSCGGQTSRDVPGAPSPSAAVRLGVEGATNAGVSIAASGNHVVTVWAATSDGQTNVFAAVSEDGALSFGPAMRVNETDGDARVAGEQAPRVAIGRDVVVAWVSRAGGQSRIRMARSTDGGRSFAAATTMHEAGLAGIRGWASLAIDRDDRVQVAWLDGREAARARAAHPPAAAGPHAMHEGVRQDVVQAAFTPDGARVETTVATHVCFCCKTAIATGPDGTSYVAWRHIYPTNVRDMAVARSVDGGRTFGDPVRVSEDGWQINGCPEDGPSIAVDTDNNVHIAWPTMLAGPDARKAVFYAVSSDGGRTFSPRLRLDGDEASAVAAHPRATVLGSRVFVVWDETDGSRRRVQLREVVSKPGSSVWTPGLGSMRAIGDDVAAVYPAIASTADAVVAAWTHSTAAGSEIRVQRID